MTRSTKSTFPGRNAAQAERGLAAGPIGTADMTASSTIESKIRKRPPFVGPERRGWADSRGQAEKPRGQKAFQQPGPLAIWLIAWPPPGRARNRHARPVGWRAFFGTVWAGEMIMVPKVSDNVPPATEWEFNDVAIDGWHHLVAMAEEAIEAGVDYLYFHQVGPDQEGFFQFWVDELQPALASRI